MFNFSQFLPVAQDLNFYGKRIRSSRLAVCDQILDKFEISQQDLESSKLCDWLLTNKPEKAEKAKIDQKLAADTMSGNSEKAVETLPVLEGDRFVITAAQNNTDPECIAELKEIADRLDARLIVLPYHYNLSAFSAAVEDDREYYHAAIKPYIVNKDHWIGSVGLARILPSVHTLATAKLPINACRDLNLGEPLTILGHAKQQMITKPRLPHQNIMQCWTTGTCTKYNYTETRAGAEAEKDHCFGALLVTVLSDSQVDCTNLVRGSNGFMLLDDADYCDLVLGDLHCEMLDQTAFTKTLDLIDQLPVRNIALHDVLHFQTRSHHNRKSGKHIFRMFLDGSTVEDDLTQVIDQINMIAGRVSGKCYLVESNHNSALDNWLDDSSYQVKQDPENAKIYYLLNYAMYEALEAGKDLTALEVAFTNPDLLSDLPPLASNVEFGSAHIAETWSDFAIHCHGHHGQNGSRGNTGLFHKWNMKLVSGHTHSPCILGSAYTVGVTASLDQGYNRGGASSWDQAHAIILPNSTVQMWKVNPLTK